jgi:hypothetical protein
LTRTGVPGGNELGASVALLTNVLENVLVPLKSWLKLTFERNDAVPAALRN